jgi:hypothetical protein
MMPSIEKVTGKIKRTVYRNHNPFLLRYLLRPRRFQGYCVGTGKSGTHSLAGLFQRHYWTAHEPDWLTIEMILAMAKGSVSKPEIIDYVKRRDKRLWLEFESSNLGYFFIDYLVQLFPQAKFILTIRDCYSWLESLFNQQLTHSVPVKWLQLRHLRFGSNQFKHAPEEKTLADRGLYPLEAYLAYWSTHNRKILTTVPPERLLVIRTDEITQDIPKIAQFFKIPIQRLDSSNAHLYKASQKVGLLSKIDQGFLKDKVNLYTKDLMDQYFPDPR